MNKIDDLLNSSDDFYCERASYKLSVETCLYRQEANKNRLPGKPIPFAFCERCSQGAINRISANRGGQCMKSSNPQSGKGYKKLDCDLYQSCLDLAARNNWKAFNCEGCTNTEIEKHANAKLCNCGKPVIHPNSKLCASCMARLAHKTKKGPERAVKAHKTKTKGYEPQKSTKPAQRQADGACSVDFREYASVLSEIEILAKEEVRPLNYQIIHMLKEQLKIKNLPKGNLSI